MASRSSCRLLISVLAVVLWAQLSSAQNPISPSGTYIPDPSARVGADGRMYVYGSLDIEDGRYCSGSYHLLSSDDLCNWTLTRNIFNCDETLYAPDMIFHNGRYHLFYDCPGGSEWVAASDRPEGPFSDITRIEGPDQIDPCIFIDDDRQAYYFWGQFSGKGARMTPDLKSLVPGSIKDSLVTEDAHYFHEGSFVFKRGKYYYYTYASVRRRNKPTCLSYAMSTNPLGPYEYKGEIIDNAGCDPEVWNNHGSVVEYKGKWYVFYHRSTHGGRFMRKACVEPLEFREDGTIIEVEMTSQGAGKPLDAYSVTDAWRACLLNGNTRIARDTDKSLTSPASGSSAREIITGTSDGDWAAFKYLDFSGRTACRATVRVRPKKGGHIGIGLDQVYTGECGGIDIPSGNGTDWVELSFPFEYYGNKNVRTVFVHFSGNGGPDLFDLDWIKFE